MKIVIHLDNMLEKNNMTQRELARKTGIRVPSINEMYHNQTIRLPLDNLAKICEALQCEITDILELVKEPIE
ncbi:helix-turn-helix domain-containing protein [Metabacillus arenae]|uniref:Helix-turn-helix transcriptional regulator n=1 Tax=Metabacillus arenae TaxID=2771434 RepID=A0A926RW63_9BACI|nr:helix-turn-helix transcriptional regulator [Metabacillus arenae]MBD1379235.1 helix-turn-helix transcriptional regulator [Metabacillus arenae]